jgi:ATP-dependent Lhr-like helicase
VIQLGTLASSSTFLQRVGRTGRRKERPQCFRGLSANEKDLVLLTAVMNLGLAGVSEKIHFPHKALHIMAHQVICLSLQYHGIEPEKAWKILSGVSAFSEVSWDQFVDLVNFMIEKQYLRDIDGELVIGEAGEKNFLKMNWLKLFAVFDTAPMYEVFDGKKHVGTLDSSFVEGLEIPFLFVLGGIEWEAYKIKPESRILHARKSQLADAPKWDVIGSFDVPLETAKEAGKILVSLTEIPEFLDQKAREGINTAREKQKYLKWEPGCWVIASSPSVIQVWTFAGDKINRTLANLFRVFSIGDAKSDYQHVHFKIKDPNFKQKTNEILEFLYDLGSSSPQQLSDYYSRLKDSMKLHRFSKFSCCLPKYLFGEALAERVYDFKGLITELRTNTININKLN